MVEKKFLNKTFSKMISWVLAIVMFFSMIPANLTLAADAAGNATNITVHFQNEHSWTTPGIQWWQFGNVTPSCSANDIQEISGWGGAKGALLADDGDGFYSIGLKGDIQGFQFLDMNSPSTNTGGKGYDEVAMPQFNDANTPKDLYGIWVDADSNGSKESIKWYLDKAGTEELKAPASAVNSTDLTVHFKNERNWDTVYGKFGSGGSWTAITDYEYCMSGYGGIINKNTSNEGWYSYRITKNDALTVNGFFNVGAYEGTNQSKNYSIPITAEVMEVWVTYDSADSQNVSVSVTKPGGWVDGASVTAPVNPATLTEIKSPVINEDGSVTFNYEADKQTIGSNKVCLMGELTDWSNGLEMKDEDGDGVYSITIPDVKPGRYGYKFKIGATWTTDPANSKYTTDGNSLLLVEGFIINAENPAGVGEFDVSVTLSEDTQVEKDSIVWSVTDENKEPVTGISISSNSIEPTKAVITTTEEAKTGYIYVNADYKDNGKQKDASVKLYFTSRAFLYEYEYKQDSQNEGKSDIYTWYNSKAGNVGAKFKEVNGKNTAYITLDDATKNFGYIVRLLGEWGADESTDREYGDRSLAAYEGERYTKVKGGEGIETPYMLPSGKTSYKNGIVFAWRDDARFYNNTMDELDGKVSVVIEKAGSSTAITKQMTYNAEDELFTYTFNAEEGLTEGTFDFYFVVDGVTVEDQYFNGTIEYQKPELDIKVTVTPEQADYDDNPVLSFDIKDKDSNADIEVSEITADLTNLGYAGKSVQFNPLSKEGVLYVDRSVAAGTHEVPVTITDMWGNETKIDVDVNIIAKADNDSSWDESRVYFLLTDRFLDGDSTNNQNVRKDMIESYHGGDFKGLTSKLGYLQELGINTIWITPIVDNIDHVKNITYNQYGYHGYWAKDFTTLDEHLGDTAAFDKLIDEAHKRGIKIMVDIVVNHAGYDTNDQANFAGMFRTEEDIVEGDVILDELDHMPDFKTEDPEVRAQLVAWQTAWVNHTTAAGNRIDYFRVDTVKHVEHETWQDLKTSITKSNSDFKMIGEYYGASINNTGDYLGNGQMDALLDFDFKTNARNFVNGKIDSVESILESRNSQLTNSITMGQFLSSHDEDGFLYSLDNDTSKMKVAAALQMTAKGIPVVYYGEEINLTGPNDFGNQKNNRYDMQFTNLSADQKEMLTHYKKLLAARAMYSNVFAAGGRTKLAGSDANGYVVFERNTANDSVYVGLNTKNTDATATFSVSANDLGNIVDLYSGKTIPVTNGKVTVTIPASSKGGTVILAKGKTLTNVEFNGPNKTAYTAGEALDLDGVTVTGVYGETKVPVSADAYTVDVSAFNKDKAGTYDIKVSYEGYSATFKVTVTKTEEEKPEEPVLVNKISFAKNSYNVAKGKSVAVAATVSPENAANKNITWSSSNTKVATVDANGKVTGKAYGVATITAKAADGSNITASCKVTVGYKITYKLNGGKNHASNPSSYYNSKVTFKSPTRKGYTFKGFYTDKKFKKKITSIKKGTKKDITVYAKWEKMKKPAKAVLKSVKAGKGSMTITMGKKASGVKGYQIVYGTDKKVKKNKVTVTTTGTKKKVKSLKKGRTYYVKARAYKLDSAGKKVYGSYSSVKKVNIK